MKRIFFILLFLSLLTLSAFSQGNNSVNITVLGCGNYSAKLSDYYSPKNAGMITIILRNNDLKEPVLPIQLYMSVTNNLKTYIQTKSPNTSKIFQLYAGETLTLTGQDLECIFNMYYLNYKKPNFQDGQNILKIYARDTRTGKIVSNTTQILLKSVMIAPPKLTSPNDNFTIETDNQFINFTWRGDNGGANIATRCNYRYKFELWKQNFSDKNVEAQRFADFTADNLFDEKYQFLLANFPFEIGQKYCWRVTAYDPFEKATFLQNGKSEVRSFIYKHIPVPVTGLKHTINERNRQATVTWNAAEGHTKYYVEYYNPQTTKTIAMEKDEPKFTLASAPEKEYTILFRVKAQCWGDDSRCSNWSDWDTIKYAAPQIVEPKYPCGYQFPKVEITNFELKTDFKEGDIVSEANGSSDYEIINCKSDGDGVLQGQFYLIMNAWGGAKIACEFWDTKINTDNQIITTRYRSIDTPVGMVEPEELANYVKSLWLDGNSLATSSKIRDTIVIDQKFDYLYRRENGEFVAVVVNSDGSTTETEFDLHKNPSQTLITDGKGDSLVYSQNGQVMGIKEYRATGGNAALLKDYHRKSDSLAQWKINFLPDTVTQIYGFDYLGSGNHGIYSGSEYYPSVNGYDLRYKSVECYKTDKVIVDFGSYPEKDSVIFKDKYGVKLKVSKGNVLNFTGVAKPDTNYIYAYRGDQKIGKLSVNTYRQKTYKVVLVSVNGAKLPKISKVEEYLNKVYKQSVVNFEISTDELSLNDLTSFSHGGSGVLTVYNDDQKTVLRAYDPQMQDGVYYLFFVDNVTDKKDGDGTMVAGYMPRGYNCGFIYDGGSPHTIAHELGHGIAGLEHVFENSKSSGKTQNLMDYSDGEELWHFQWDAIQDPSRVWMKWNKDEEEGEGFFAHYGTTIQKFLWSFRYAYVNKANFVFDLVNNFSENDIKLADEKKYKKLGFEVKSAVNTTLKKIEGKNVGIIFDEFEYNYGNFKFFTDDNKNCFEKFVFPELAIYTTQRDILISQIISEPNGLELIKKLSILPEKEYSIFDVDTRISLLKKLSKEHLTESYSILVKDGIDGEKAVINLLKYAPNDQKCELISFLMEQKISNDMTYYDVFDSEIDNLGGADNSDEYKSIVQLFKSKCYDRLLVLAEKVKQNFGTLSQNLSNEEQLEILNTIRNTEDWKSMLERLDNNNRYLYTYLREGLTEENYQAFVNMVYNKTKDLYRNNIPYSIVKKYVQYYASTEMEILEPEEDVVLHLIESSSDKKTLLDFMSENDLFRPLVSKIDNANGFSGGDNYDKFYILCFNKWRELYPEVNEVLFHKYTKFAFRDWLTRIIGERNITHIEISASTQVGVGVFNGIASTALGYATDAYGNVALYGNFVASASVVPVGNVRWNSISEFFQNDISQQIDKFPDCNIIAGNGAGVTLSVNFDYAAKNLTDLFGKGSSISESFNFRGLGLSFIQNFDGDNNFIGVGLGLDLTASGAVKFTKATVENKGIIVSKKEFEYLKKMSFNGADFEKQVFEIRKVDKINNIGILYVFNIPTNIEVVDKSDYYISVSVVDFY